MAAEASLNTLSWDAFSANGDYRLLVILRYGDHTTGEALFGKRRSSDWFSLFGYPKCPSKMEDTPGGQVCQ